ncbi:MAG: tetratricopeptide repeat protein [Planctomycetaceae bacterium]|nr:tetratricopeptide repeat protein [Planctomycetaceae bacterium]MCA9043032.1 tetratricopeptide repeat protein [Planctomycetaceae bacterium]MCB9951374.1 tetratricopeptide repeat protein [Planctomycetaceae bacterium]
MRRDYLACLMLVLAAGCGGGSEETAEKSAPESAPQVAESTTQTPAAQATQEFPPVDQLITLAEAQLKKRDAQAALNSLTMAIEHYPKEVAPFVKRGALLADAGLLPAAIKDLTSAIELDPDNAKLRNTRGYFFLLSKNYDWAYKDFSDAVGRDLQYPQPYNNRGLVQIAKQDYEAAVKEFDAALAIDPKYVDALNNRGFALMQLERVEESLTSFTKALELDPKYLNALNNRGRAYHKLERFAEAVADFTAAIDLNPTNLQYYAHRAEANRGWGRTRESRLDLDHITRMQELRRLDARIQQSPEEPKLWVERGALLTTDGQTKQATACFERALKFDEKCTEAWIGQARLAAQAEHWQNVLSHCDAALAITPGLHEALSLRGDAHYALEHLDQALTDYAAARRMDSHVAQAYKQRADRYQKEGKTDLANADLQIAVSFDRSLGNGDVVPASANVPERAPARFPTAEELREFQEKQRDAEVVPAEQETVVE